MKYENSESLIPHYVIKYRGKYISGTFSIWNGFPTSDYRLGAMTYSYQGVKSILELHPQLDVDVIKIEYVEYLAIEMCRKQRRRMIFHNFLNL